MARTFSSPVRRIGPVLLVDDYDDARAQVREALENAGYHVVEARHGQQALDFLVSRPDETAALVILDLQMPIMDGWKLLDLMRNYVGLSSIPIIIVTAHQPRREQLRNPAIFACFEAPYALEELIDAVDTCLTAARRPATMLVGNEGQ
jgi:chemosensory pili system protein ChpA (sensor histidine kinase/response regulator)